MLLTQADLQTFQAQYPDHRLELVNGKVIVMSSSGYESDEVAAETIRLLGNWVRPRKLGRVAASSAGFRLPNDSRDVRVLRLPEVLPGWEVPVSDLWPPVFE